MAPVPVAAGMHKLSCACEAYACYYITYSTNTYTYDYNLYLYAYIHAHTNDTCAYTRQEYELLKKLIGMSNKVRLRVSENPRAEVLPPRPPGQV